MLFARIFFLRSALLDNLPQPDLRNDAKDTDNNRHGKFNTDVASDRVSISLEREDVLIQSWTSQQIGHLRGYYQHYFL
jgi:hypothetical protein